MTLGELLARRASEQANKVFLFFKELEVTYRQFDDRTHAVANGLIKSGVQKGEAVALLLPNSPEFLYAFFGIVTFGGIAVPINTQLKSEEITYILENAKAKGLVTTPELYEKVRPVRNRLPRLELLYLTGERGREGFVFSGLLTLPKTPPKIAVDPHDPAALIYTSGTTGRPKGVVLTHRNYLFDTEQTVRAARMSKADRFLCILPLFHVNGQVVTTLSPLFAGGSMILMERFAPKDFFPILSRFKATAFSGVPTVYAMLLQQFEPGKYDLSSLRFCICGAAPMAVELFEKFEAAFHAFILEGYGLSEGTCVSSLNPLDGKRKIGSIGLPLSGQEMTIFDDRDRELAFGQVGEIVIRGENVMTGYYGNPQATAETLRGGWLHTGDLGYRDEEGYFFIVGRKKEMIIRGGENIYPKEIEEALYRHPRVAEAAVVGLPDPVWGEEVAAFIVSKAGPRPEDLPDGEEILAFCRERLANFKCPRKVIFVPELPKTATGKIQKGVLRENYLKGK